MGCTFLISGNRRTRNQIGYHRRYWSNELDAISRGGRKKDFWDLSEILKTHSMAKLFEIYQQKYPWFEIKDVVNGLSNFKVADIMPDPICYKKKNWDAIKNEILSEASKL